MRRFISGLALSFCVLLVNSCSTGSDPEDIILDVFSVPAELTLQIENVFNDLAMDVNGIAMHKLEFTGDLITTNVAKCLKASVHRNSQTFVLDSIVLDYGTVTCSSNGAAFKGKVIVDPKDEDLKSFDIRLKDFKSYGYSITGAIEFQITGETAGKDFSMKMENAEFLISGTGETVYTVTVASINNVYTFFKSEEGLTDYTDDIFKFTTSLSGETPDGALFNLESSSDLIYAYSCKNIIGGKADFSLSDIGDGIVNFGGGDPESESDCDAKATVSAFGANISITL
ncbi:hypothetical protein [Labilibaculum euxinus]|uniref:DUF4382 domain-containing protein n=1 Tax=Labilibaculum euxinus TaxID=2686357 RepID=A0A7M4D5H2_9BACT|nr:hypothetical protein [Labilibaculum euxinus]MUP37901.1 hypothetical protein [Labilibaculum euxinus]MVB07106.1 hypothetical protein [Labilibaculum euxinus]